MGNEVSDRSRLIQIAGAIAMHVGFVSPCADDHSRATPRSIIKQAEDQDTRLKDWAYELRQIADRMIASTPSPLTPEGLDAIIDAIPTNWLDSLLTGPDAVLHGKGGTWGCPDIERLLSAIKERQKAIASKLMTVTPSPPLQEFAGALLEKLSKENGSTIDSTLRETIGEIAKTAAPSSSIQSTAREKRGREMLAAELLNQLDRITSTTAAFHLVKSLCLIEVGRDPDTLGVVDEKTEDKNG